MASKKVKNHTKNPLETEETSGNKLIHSLAEEGKLWGQGILEQLIGSYEQQDHPKSGELKPGQEVHLGKIKTPVAESSWNDFLFGKNNAPKSNEVARKADIAPGMDYHREIATLESRMDAKEKSELIQAVQQIQIELQRLVASSSMLQVEFSEVTMAQAPKSPGKYHVNFFQWVLAVIQQARMKVEDAGAWQAAMKGKRKNGYQDRAKKEGTTFTQSMDRNVATQAG